MPSFVKDIRHVINYDMPNGIEDYVHRIGRSGRAGDKGHSISFMTQKNAKMAHQVRESYLYSLPLFTTFIH